jgi:hypothetical protein
MKTGKWAGLLCAIFLLLVGGAQLGLTEIPDAGTETPTEGEEEAPTSSPTPPPPVPLITYYTGVATITTTNCNSSTSTPAGLCQPAPACNGGAGPNPVNITAKVTVCEARTGTAGELTVVGGGTGFEFGKTYVSLLYKNPNVATCSRFPAGVDATLENATNPLSGVDNDFASMHLGFWVVGLDGSATLNLTKQATVTNLRNYATVSVREMQPPNTNCFNTARDPAPQLNALRACGALTVVRAQSSDCLQ